MNKIIDIHKLKSKIVIYFKDNKLDISPSTFIEYNLFVNKELSESKIKEIKAYDLYQKDLNYALNLIAKYTYTTCSLEKKLNAKGISVTNIKKIMLYINKHHLIDDYELAKALVNELIAKAKGESFIQNHLFIMGIDKEIIAKLIDDISQDELVNNAVKLIKILDSKYTRKKVVNKKDKIYASLKQHGYSNIVINKAFDLVTLSKIDINDAINKDYKKFKRMYDDDNKIINALKRKGYSYSKIKEVIKENNNDLY